MSSKYLGVLTAEIANNWNILEHAGKLILVFDDRMNHVIEHHLKDFGSISNIEKSYDLLASIIRSPDYVFYNSKTKGLEYYKFNICVAVRVSSGKFLKVRSWYPMNEYKIQNRKKKELEVVAK